jgi:hypothetical protein
MAIDRIKRKIIMGANFAVDSFDFIREFYKKKVNNSIGNIPLNPPSNDASGGQKKFFKKVCGNTKKFF